MLRTTFGIIVGLLPVLAVPTSPALAQNTTAAPAAGAQDLPTQYAALRAQRNELRQQISSLRHKLEKSDDLAPLRTALAEAEAAHDKAKTDTPEVVAAKKARDAAREAYDNVVKGLPEAKAAADADEAYEKARHALPEYTKRKEAEKALGELAKTAPTYAAAKAAAKEAGTAYETAKTAMPEYKASMEAAKALKEAGRKLPEYPLYQDAQKTYDAAYQDKLAVPRKARDEARKALEGEATKKLAADPEGLKLQAQLKQVEQQYEAIKEKLRDSKK